MTLKALFTHLLIVKSERLDKPTLLVLIPIPCYLTIIVTLPQPPKVIPLAMLNVVKLLMQLTLTVSWSK